MKPVHILREDIGQYRNYYLISDQCVVLIEMRAMLGGWRLLKTSEQGSEAWANMSADAIRAYKVSGNTVTVLEAHEREYASVIALAEGSRS